MEEAAVYCLECYEQGNRVRVRRRLGAWWCPTHRDCCHIRQLRKLTPTEMLREFHAALGDEPGRGNARLRISLHCEEHAELLAELNNLAALEPMEDLRDLPESRKKLARELADVVYVAFGTAHAFDVDLHAALEEIHRAAMSKIVRPNGEPPVTRADGKILKPPEFVPPDMSRAVA